MIDKNEMGHSVWVVSQSICAMEFLFKSLYLLADRSAVSERVHKLWKIVCKYM